MREKHYAFARSQEAEIRKLAEVGGVQAASTARLDAERIGRDIRTAQETGGSRPDGGGLGTDWATELGIRRGFWCIV